MCEHDVSHTSHHQDTNLLDIVKGRVPAHPQGNVNRVGQQARQIHAVGRRGRPVVPRIGTTRRRNHCYDISPSEFPNYPHNIFVDLSLISGVHSDGVAASH